MPPPPIPNRDREHLDLLGVFHYVTAGLDVLFLGFLGVHYAVMRMVFGNPEMWKDAKSPPPFNPEEFLGMFVWIYVFGAVFQLSFAVVHFLSGRYLRQRKHRTFSMVVAGLSCLSMPLGTILGVFTLVVLCRESVTRLYAATEAERSSSPHELSQSNS